MTDEQERTMRQRFIRFWTGPSRPDRPKGAMTGSLGTSIAAALLWTVIGGAQIAAGFWDHRSWWFQGLWVVLTGVQIVLYTRSAILWYLSNKRARATDQASR
ncbi:hypothetical protein FHX74_001657 [Friedmanniella endophytica]|uniref:Uncharacterized protein n=1 Tax=Microlunatus kandeliicorticis TaxID=1759536 RepID=A0A7W3P5N6_9ACTN|nr:hypothetical protein [Microlunatus kandeliicorticis]MBA8794052.1 hypothetical protein [Microlunatus kandeliicorticis]